MCWESRWCVKGDEDKTMGRVAFSGWMEAGEPEKAAGNNIGRRKRQIIHLVGGSQVRQGKKYSIII